jgi:hypothetical protein
MNKNLVYVIEERNVLAHCIPDATEIGTTRCVIVLKKKIKASNLV